MRRKRFKIKKVNIFWNFIKDKVKVTLITFLNFVNGSCYLGTKKVDCYLISFEPQTVQSSYKDYLSKLFLRSTKLKYWLSQGWLFESYRSLKFLTTFNVFWWYLFGKLSSRSKNFLFTRYKQFKNYEPFKLNLSCEIIRENLHAIFVLSNNSSNYNKSQILFLNCKIYARWHF